MNLTTTAIITKGMFGGPAKQLVVSNFQLYYISSTPIVIRPSGGGGGSVYPDVIVGRNFSSKMFNTSDEIYIEITVIFNGNKKIIQHHISNILLAEFSIQSHHEDFSKFTYSTDVENDERKLDDTKVTLH